MSLWKNVELILTLDSSILMHHGYSSYFEVEAEGVKTPRLFSRLRIANGG